MAKKIEAEMGYTGYRNESCFSNEAFHKGMKDGEADDDPLPLFHLKIHVNIPNELNGRTGQITGVELHPTMTEVIFQLVQYKTIRK